MVKRLHILSLHGFITGAVVSSNICKTCDSNRFEALNCPGMYEKQSMAHFQRVIFGCALVIFTWGSFSQTFA